VGKHISKIKKKCLLKIIAFSGNDFPENSTKFKTK
jgi:hypothetical protein